MEALSGDKWSLYQDNEGKVFDEYTIRKIAFHKGISEDIRHKVWPFLLGYYPFNSTSEERRKIDDEKREHYESLMFTWRDSDGFVPTDNFQDCATLIDKDCVRTDRSLEFFSDENINNVFTLERILKTFAFFRPGIGYVQGMSDILALPLMVLNSEHQAFWCFDYIMKTKQGVIFSSDLTLLEPLENLAKLCHHIDQQLFEHLNLIHGGEHWLFTYRWLLLHFRRELTVEGVSRLWECFWSSHATEHFPLFFTVSVLVHFRDIILQYTNFEQLMQFSQNVRDRIPVTLVLSQAISLLERLKADDYCPYDIKFLISNEVSSPPPLVGFVRTRQKLTSLYTNKTEMQRDQIWKSLFGDTTPLQSITSPLRSPPTTISLENTLNYSYFTTSSESTSIKPPSLTVKEDWPIAIETQLQSSTLQQTPPPKMGFVPREKTIVDQIRNDIRRTQPTSEIVQCNNQLNISTEQLYSRNVWSTDCSHPERTTDNSSVLMADSSSSTNYCQAPVDQMTPVLSDDRSCLVSSPQLGHRYSDSNTYSHIEVPNTTQHGGVMALQCRGSERCQHTAKHCPGQLQCTCMSPHNPLPCHKNSFINNCKSFTHTCFSPPMLDPDANTILDCSSTDATQFDSLRAEPELKCY